ncbi:hypothetical protein [Calidifontibacter indicus]|uniref:Uncharacterized protein n=1 Tax=Calidifontibacter indicus TaxID=419650 RepID=A0A3D9UP28_9MICO|nr:hypothetical protein [Calidifontibacter indicus]REF30183.1 hypothetical protein DFJ65_1177 [Calidifontibacter indicus]
MDTSTGVVFPVSNTANMAESHEEERSSSAFGRAVVAEALASVDAAGADAAQRDTGWRRGYPQHLRRLVEVGATDHRAAMAIARDGLASVHDRMCWLPASGGHDRSLADAFATPLPHARWDSVTVAGEGAAETEFTLPYKGTRLQGDALRERLDGWVTDGVIEPGVRDAVNKVLDNPDWLDVRDRTFVVLGAGAEMGPLRSLLRWGGRVVGIDLPRAALWSSLFDVARQGAGSLVVPVAAGRADASDPAQHAGADLLHDIGGVGDYLLGLDGPFVLGNYVYADGGVNLRLSAATDALALHLSQRDDVALAYLATPTDVFVVPDSAVAQANSGLDRAFLKSVRRPLRAVSRGRLLQRQYPPEPAGVSLSDTIVPQQGPNYLLAKRIHRWRAAAAAADGQLVSMNIAPPTRTRSVTKNRALAAAYAGAHRFGVEVFDPSTANTLMAAMLVHDLRTGGYAAKGDMWQAEAAGAAHGGLWRSPYDPRSALGIAAVLGFGSAR